MAYRLFASDFDDTLVPIGNDLSERNRAAIARVRAAGVQFVIASGRTTYGLLYNARKNGIETDGLYIIGYNGAQVTQAWDGKQLFAHPLDIELAQDAARVAAGFPVAIMVPEGADVFTNLPDDFSVGFETGANHTNPVLMTDFSHLDFAPSKLLFGGDRAELERLATELRAQFSDVAEIMFSADFLLEFNAKGVTKGEALQGLCAALGIDISESVAIGDNHNDLAMIKAAGLGVAVANAVPPLLAAADKVSVASEDDAVAVVLDELFPE